MHLVDKLLGERAARVFTNVEDRTHVGLDVHAYNDRHGVRRVTLKIDNEGKSHRLVVSLSDLSTIRLIVRLVAGVAFQHFDRAHRQLLAYYWAKRTFGDCSMDVRERSRRFLEEALELVQSLDLPEEECRDLVEYVYARPKGNAAQEVGGVGVTLIVLCNVIGVDADEQEIAELERVGDKSAEYFKARQNRKAELGVGVKAE